MIWKPNMYGMSKASLFLACVNISQITLFHGFKEKVWDSGRKLSVSMKGSGLCCCLRHLHQLQILVPQTKIRARRKSACWKRSAVWENGARRGKKETLSALQIERRKMPREVLIDDSPTLPVVNDGVSAGAMVEGAIRVALGQVKSQVPRILT